MMIRIISYTVSFTNEIFFFVLLQQSMMDGKIFYLTKRKRKEAVTAVLRAKDEKVFVSTETHPLFTNTAVNWIIKGELAQTQRLYGECKSTNTVM